MAITLSQIQEYLKNNALRYQQAENRPELATGFRMHNYRNDAGEPTIFIVIRLEEDGEFLKIFAPLLYRVKDHPHIGAVMIALLGISWRTKMLQFEYDEINGEVRGIVEFPVEDGTVTERQFMRALHGLASIIDELDPIVRRALEIGKVSFEENPPTELASLMELVSQLGGPKVARAVLQEHAKDTPQ